MSRYSWGWASAAVVLAGVVAGCGPQTWWHLLKGDEEMKAKYPLAPAEGRREVVVAVCVTAGPGVPAGADLDLANKIGGQLKSVAEMNKDTPVQVVDQNKIYALRTKDPTAWQTGGGGEFAKKVAADYWVDVTLTSLKLKDGSYGNEICRGQAELDVAVYEAGKAEPKFTYHHTSQAPARPTDPVQVNSYSNQYLGQVATEIAFKHVKYKKEQERAMEK